jgi:hypothetical protein
MFRNTRVQMAAFFAVGALLGYLVASGGLNPFSRADANSPAAQPKSARPADPHNGDKPACCEDVTKAQLLARADEKPKSGGDEKNAARAAPETTGTPGSPNATTTIDGRYLPNPPAEFGGQIKTNAAQSKPYWPARAVPPKGAPNVLLIMTDDVGFAAPSTFGGVIPTPALDRVARMGLRYTRFHTTALCSPTRAALLEQFVLPTEGKSAMNSGGSLVPSTAFVYDFGVLPLGQQMWLRAPDDLQGLSSVAGA